VTENHGKDHACKDLAWCCIASHGCTRTGTREPSLTAAHGLPNRKELSTAVVKVTADLSALYYINVCSPTLGMYGWVDATIKLGLCVTPRVWLMSLSCTRRIVQDSSGEQSGRWLPLGSDAACPSASRGEACSTPGG
jgi:hypothetical protein